MTDKHRPQNAVEEESAAIASEAAQHTWPQAFDEERRVVEQQTLDLLGQSGEKLASEVQSAVDAVTATEQAVVSVLQQMAALTKDVRYAEQAEAVTASIEAVVSSLNQVVTDQATSIHEYERSVVEALGPLASRKK
jgi:hypothetical protein